MANTKIQSEQIQDGAITAAKIADGAIVAAEVADNAITTAKINADAVTGAKIADDAINSEHYTDGSIDTAHIADANITTAKIADDAVTSAKIDTNIDIAGTFDVTGATTLDSTLTVKGAAIFNEDSADVDFRVESNDSANMLVVDAGDNKVLVEANNTGAVSDSASMVAASAFEINGNASEGSDKLRFFAMGSAGNYGMEVSNSGGNAQYDLCINPINKGAVIIGGTTLSAHGNVDDLQIGDNTGNRGIGIHSANSGTGAIFFADGDSSLSGQLEYAHASDHLSSITGGNQRLRVDAHGVKFNTNTAETDALDDYEEGSWTIAVSSSDPTGMTATPSNAYGWYVKVGKVVHVGGSFDLAVSNGQGTMRITGLPYACSSNGTRPLFTGQVGYTINVVPQPGYITIGNGSTSDYIDVWREGNNTRYNIVDWDSGGRMNFQITYEAN